MFAIGLLGCGGMGRQHAARIVRSPRLSLKSVFDPNAENARSVAERFGVSVAANAQALIDDPAIDAVVIVAATQAHPELMLAAARAGKPMYAEKPIALDIEKANATAAALARFDVPIFTGFQKRFDNDNARMHAEVSAGDIGAIRTVLMTARGPNTHRPEKFLRESGGLYRDKGVHYYDLVRWLLREEPVEIVAMDAAIDGPMYKEIGDVDNAIVGMRFASGALCQIDHARRAAYGYDDRIEAFGMDGMIETGRRGEGDLTRRIGRRVILDAIPNSTGPRFEAAYQGAFDAFGEVLAGERGDYPNLRDSLMAQIIAEAADRSAKQRRIVKLSEFAPSI